MDTLATDCRRPDLDLRASRHTDVDLTGVTTPPGIGPVLGRSLAVFQVGESGTGQHLFDAATREQVPGWYLDDLRAFVAEEQEHARLLALVLAAIDHPLRDGHWTDRVFVALRRLKSLRTEVLTLLVAELIALRYYSALRDGIGEPALSDVFGRIHADELRHVDFHAATLPHRLARFRRPVAKAVRLLWNILVTGTSVMVALDHGSILRASGVGRATFVRDVWRLRADLDRRLFGRLDEIRASRP